MIMKEEDNNVNNSRKWLEDLSNGTITHDMEGESLAGLHIISARKGFVLCNFVVPTTLSDQHGNWHAGAMATLIDDVGASAIYSSIGQMKVSVDFSVSYISTVKIQEEVEIEAKVLGELGKLTSVIIEVRRKSNGELVALGKQWMASPSNTNRTNQDQLSKL
ncbi:uncharacterized protein LOC125419032 [Ziziphus jujuba]|uniref:Uncharacterized protein LOC125419032 n=2 Tax=Ziziphus jujuba TaxID=326968 RepID=A0ABM3I3K3_ZIZJJ|nr:uncharacterized protein LOC125419032 [Ziziphus jujuba]KAH7547260.1 hypothetical protein FEM48_Zijuj01G0291000 [Ziziphus jujuba var. spinosa]